MARTASVSCSCRRDSYDCHSCPDLIADHIFVLYEFEFHLLLDRLRRRDEPRGQCHSEAEQCQNCSIRGPYPRPMRLRPPTARASLLLLCLLRGYPRVGASPSHQRRSFCARHDCVSAAVRHPLSLRFEGSLLQLRRYYGCCATNEWVVSDTSQVVASKR